MQVTNYTGYVIDADAGGAGGRDTLDVRASLKISSDSGQTVTNGYRIRFSLLNDTGQPVDLRAGSSTTGSVSVITVVTATTVSANFNFTADLKPAGRLDPYRTYAPQVQVYDITQPLTPVASGVGTNQTYLHFTNTFSDFGDYNIIPVLQTAKVTRAYAWRRGNDDIDKDRHAFRIEAVYDVHRFEVTDLISGYDSIPVMLEALVEDQDSAVVIPLKPANYYDTNFLTRAYLFDTNTAEQLVRDPFVGSYTNNYIVFPEDPLSIIDSTHVQDLQVRLVYAPNQDSRGVESNQVPANSLALTSQRLLHFNGKLVFGAITTTVTSINNVPVILATTNDYVITAFNISSNGATLDAQPDIRFNETSPITVRVDAQGTAYVTSSGSWSLTHAGGTFSGLSSKIAYSASSLTLSTNGLFAGEITVRLPHGSGYSTSHNTQILEPDLIFSNLPLDPVTMLPRNGLVSRSGTFFVSEETKPFRFEASGVTWDATNGRLTWSLVPGNPPAYVRGESLATLEQAVSAGKFAGQFRGGSSFRRSNESYLRAATSVEDQELIFRAGADGSALTTFMLNLAATGSIRIAFPYDTAVNWTNGGASIRYEDDLIASAQSQLGQLAPVTVRYRAACPTEDCEGLDTVNEFVLASPTSRLFTADGGLLLHDVLVAPGARLRWNAIGASNFVHAITSGIQTASFYMPGHFTRGAEVTASLAYLQPAELLLAGIETNRVTYETPGEPSYFDGLGDYAGINIRSAANPGITVRSVMGGAPIATPYTLAGRSKYYLRYSGVSGIHQAAPGSFAGSASLYGYPVAFSNFALAYLSGHNSDSRTAGSVSVPYPSAFTQDFQSVTLTCLGDLNEARIPESAPPVHLDYWDIYLNTLRLSFERNQTCTAGSGTLALNVDGELTFDLIPVYGQLGFLPDGEIVAPEDGIAGLNSRFSLENSVAFQGPHGTSYTLYPVQQAYLNDHASTPLTNRLQGTGYLNLAGRLDVAFFEDIAVHFMPAARTNRTWSYMAGGWERGRGWTNALGDSFFTTNLFDLANAAYPSPGTEASRLGYQFTNYVYRPVASQRWLDIVGFDNTLSWRLDTRNLTAFGEPEEVDLLVVAAQQWVNFLGPENVWIGFGSRYLGIPKIDTAALMANAWDTFLGTNVTDFFVGNTVTNEAGRMQFISLTNGLASLDLLVDRDMTLLEFALTNYLNEVATNLVESIAQGFDNNETTEQLNARVDGYLGGTATNVGTLRHVLSGMTDRQAYATNLVTIMQDALDDVGSLLDSLVEGTSFIPPSGETEEETETEEEPGLLQLDRLNGGSGFAKMEAASKSLIFGIFGSLSGILGENISTIDQEISGILRKLAPKLHDARNKVAEMQEQVAIIRMRLDDGGDLLNSIANTLSEEAIGVICDDISADIKDRVIGPAIAARDRAPIPALAQALSQALARAIRQQATLNSLHATVINPAVNELDSGTRDTLNKSFGAIEETLNEILAEVYKLVEDELKPMLGDIGNHVEAASIRGSVAAQGDLIREVVLNANVKINASDYGPVKASADFYYNAQRGAGQRGCGGGPSEPAHQVELKVRGGPIKVADGRLFARMNGLFAFETSPSYSPIALKGGVESYAGYLPIMGRINLMNLAGTVGISGDEAYMGARGDAFLHLNDIINVIPEIPALKNILSVNPFIKSSSGNIGTDATGTNDFVITLRRLFITDYLPNRIQGYDIWIGFDTNEPVALGSFEFFSDDDVFVYTGSRELTAYTSVVVYASAFGNEIKSDIAAVTITTNGFAATDQVRVDFTAVMTYDPSYLDEKLESLEPIEKLLYYMDEYNILEGRFAGGLFLGRACTLGPLAFIDDDVAAVVAEAPYTGVLAYAGGDIIILDWGCWLSIGGGIGLGLFSFDDGPAGLTGTADVYGEALCTLSVAGRAQLTGAYNGWNTALAGSLRLKAEAGWCPACVKFDKKLRIVLGHERWDISLD